VVAVVSSGVMPEPRVISVVRWDQDWPSAGSGISVQSSGVDHMGETVLIVDRDGQRPVPLKARPVGDGVTEGEMVGEPTARGAAEAGVTRTGSVVPSSPAVL
jgi:hypothetical protein